MQTRTFPALIYPAGALPLSVILLTQFMRTIPPELEETAIVDGANRLQTLRKVYVPIAAPGIAAVVILSALGFWKEFLHALVLAGINPGVRTVQVAIIGLQGEGTTEFGVLVVGVLISIILVCLLYVFLNHQGESALTEGVVKG
jgi:multiple sugar transport system permease protein